MICDDCIKKDVCKYREQCNILERDIMHSKIEDVITLEVRCKSKRTRPQQLLPRGPITQPCAPREPLDSGKIWTNPIGPGPVVRFGDSPQGSDGFAGADNSGHMLP